MSESNYTNCFGDKRIERRGMQLHRGLFQHSVHSIQQIAESRAEQKGYYRFLRNDKVSEEKLIKELSERCSGLVKDRIVLSIQDTTEINLKKHAQRLNKDNGVGDTTANSGIGFFVHPSLVVDAATCTPIGFSDVNIWNREIDMPDKHMRDYSHLPLEAKESYKWTKSSLKTKAALSEAKAVIIVQDREGDIFDQFMSVPDDKTFLLIRSSKNRVTETNQKLWDRLSTSALLGTYELFISADTRRKIKERTATIEVRAVEVDIKRPSSSKRATVNSCKVYAIEAREVGNSYDDPVHWRLVTTWPVSSFEECACVIEWYTWRWQIEELFRSLKEEGYNIEASELENAMAIRKLVIMMMDVIIKLMQMRIAYNQPEEGVAADTAFDTEDQQLMIPLCKRLEGKTQKLTNPYKAGTLAWATWIIARLGGWKGYTSQRPPGLTTLQEGLKQFYNMLTGWTLTKDVGTP